VGAALEVTHIHTDTLTHMCSSHTPLANCGRGRGGDLARHSQISGGKFCLGTFLHIALCRKEGLGRTDK